MGKSHPRVSGGSGGSYSHLNMNDWQNALAQAKKASVDVVPVGWKTAQQLAKELDYSASNIANRILTPLIAVGKAERKDFNIMSGQSIHKIPHYRLIK